MPEPDISGGQKHYNLADGSILAQGYAPTKHTTEFEVKTNVENITAVRLELLNDPNLPLGGPGRSIYGTCALTEFKLDAGPADGSAKMAEVKIVSATADVNPAEKELGSIFDDKKNKRRVTGPIEYAIDRKDETAWGIDIGPGRSNVPRKAVFVLEKPISFRRRHEAEVQADAKSRRLEQRRQPKQQPGPVPLQRRPTAEAPRPIRCPLPRRQMLADRRASCAPPAQIAPFSATGERPCPSGKKPTTKSKSFGKQHPQGTSQLAMQSRDEHRQTFMLARGDFLKPTKPVQPGVPAILHPLRTENPTRLDFARWLVDERVADGCPLNRQSRLASLFRHGPGQHERRFWPARRIAVASRAARLARRRVHGERLEPQMAAPNDRHRRRPISSRRT